MNMSEKQLQVLYVEDDQEMARSLALALKRYNISLTRRLISPSVAADPDEMLRSVFDRCLSQGWKWF